MKQAHTYDVLVFILPAFCLVGERDWSDFHVSIQHFT